MATTMLPAPRALDALAAVGVHGEQARDLLVAPGARVLHFVARLEHARIDAQEDGLAALVHGHLEGQGAERRAVLGRRASVGWPVVGSTPAMGGTSVGAGRKSQTASSSGWTPLLRRAEPASTGTMVHCRVPLRRAATRAADGRWACPRDRRRRCSSSKSAAASMSFSRAAATASAMAAGTLSSRGGSSSAPEK